MRIQKRQGRSWDPSPRDVGVFQVLHRLLARWRDDPELLAVACEAASLLGYSDPSYGVQSSWEERVPSIPREEAYERVQKALYRRNRRVLRNRAEGLILALQATAEDAEAWRLHERREDGCVIECRELPIEERIAALHAKERDVGAGAVG